MSATLSLSPFSNFLIITNILHNCILYAFLFFPFYHKLTIIINFLIFFLFPTVKQPLSVSLYRGIQIRARSTQVLPYRHFMATAYLRVSLLMGIPIPHTLVQTSRISVGSLSKIVAALYITGRDSRLKSVIAHPRCLIKKEGGLWHLRRKKRISREVTSSR